jgi:hypothetical protein
MHSFEGRVGTCLEDTLKHILVSLGRKHPVFDGHPNSSPRTLANATGMELTF